MMKMANNNQSALEMDTPFKPATPAQILPKGVDTTDAVNPYTGETGQARKGTVAATVANIAMLNKLLQAPLTAETQQTIEIIVKEIHLLLPSLRFVGMFDFFSPQEWLSDLAQPGRILIGLGYIEMFPEKLTPEIITQLKNIQDMTGVTYLSAQIDIFLSTVKSAHQNANSVALKK